MIVTITDNSPSTYYVAVQVDGKCNHNGERYSELVGISYAPEESRIEDICDTCGAIV